MQMLSEKQFMEQVITLLRLHGWLHFHTHDSRRSTPGFPDLVAIHRETGRLLAAELKVGKNKPTPAQEEWLALFRKAGAEVYLWYPRHTDEIVRILGADTRDEEG